MLLVRAAILACSLSLCITAHTSAEQAPAPTFKSSELQVTVKRAKRNAAGQLAISLLIENIAHENVALYGVDGAGVTTESGETAEPSDVVGLPFCVASCQNPVSAVGVHVEPVVVEKDGSLLAIYLFPGEGSKGACSLDLAVRLYVARLGGGTQPTHSLKWHQISVGLANLSLC